MRIAHRILTLWPMLIGGIYLGACTDQRSADIRSTEEVKGEEVRATPGVMDTDSMNSLNPDNEAILDTDATDMSPRRATVTRKTIHRQKKVSRMEPARPRWENAPIEVPAPVEPTADMKQRVHVDMAVTDGITGLGFAGKKVAKVPVVNIMNERFGMVVVTSGATSEGPNEDPMRIFPAEYREMADNGAFPTGAESVATEGASTFGSNDNQDLETQIDMIRFGADAPVAAR